jgi:ParB/RepB/Spo0J family partition protein
MRSGLMSLPTRHLEVDPDFNHSDQIEADDLLPSIQAYGILAPIHVRKKEGSDSYYVIDGHRRLDAAIRAELPMVPVYDHGQIDNVEAGVQAYQQNCMRRVVSKQERMDWCKYLQKAGLGVTDIAQKLHMGKSTVSEYLTISRAEPSVSKAATKAPKKGGITTKTALKAAKLPKEQQKKAAPAIKGKTAKQADVILGPKKPGLHVAPLVAPIPPPDGYMVPDYVNRCKKIEAEIDKRLLKTPSSQKLLGMQLVIGVLRGKMTVEQAFIDWQKV